MLHFLILAAVIIIIGPIASLLLAQTSCSWVGCSTLVEMVWLVVIYAALAIVAFKLHRRLAPRPGA